MTKNYIDISILENLMGDDNSNLRRLLHELLTSSLTNSERLFEHFEAKKWEGLKSSAHFLKGNAKYLGNEDLLSLLRKIEHEAIHERNYDHLTALIQEYKKLLSFIKVEMSLYIAHLN